MDPAAQRGAAVEEAELTWLIVQQLCSGPFAELGAALAAAAGERGLLPCRHDTAGAQHALSLPELQRRYAHLPPDALRQLLAQLLDRRRSEAPQPAARGLTSLLEGGALRVLSLGPGAPPPPPPPPAWLRPGGPPPSQAHRLLLLRAGGLGVGGSGTHAAGVCPPAEAARALQHHLTVRGHRFAVYCVAYDRCGRFAITGSDDRLVKIWSLRTGLLQASCRGHDAEVTDLAVSCDNALVASASMDGSIRVWNLEGPEGRPGLPVSVLLGHGGPVAFLDFHPALPDALVSASFDGTLRLWRARDAAAPPIVLTVDPQRFGLTGTAITRLGGLGWPGFHAGDLLASAGMRTTRGMERQLMGLPSGAAGGSQQQQQAPQQQQQQRLPQVQSQGARSGRSARQLRNLSEIMAAEAGRLDDSDADEEEQQPDGDGAAAAAAGPASQAADGGEGVHEGGTGLLVCGFSRDGTHIVAGGNDCNVYVWQWDVPQPAAGAATPQPQQQAPGRRRQSGGTPGSAGAPAGQLPADGLEAVRAQQAAAPPPPAQRQQEQQPRRSPAGTLRRSPAAAAAAAGDGEAPWPVPREVCQLKGHRNDVVLLQFSHDGERAATGSKDGSVRVWRRPRRWRKKPQAWEQEVTFAVLPDPEAIKEARRRRRPPPAPSIDQIAWTADDQRLIVSVTDYGVRVLAMPSGQLLHHLTMHTSNVHILECHPTDPALAFSASYDGSLAVWDTRSGAVLRRFSSRNTRPDGRSWPEVLPLTDGHFSPDGSTITVADVAGQVHHYALGPRSSLLARAPYDQFLTTDYSPLLRDLHGHVLDAESQQAPHLAPGALCDALGTPYPPLLQAAYSAQRLLAAPAADVAWQEPGKEPGFLLAAPTLTAAAWAVEQAGGSDHAVQIAIARAQEQLTIHEDRLNAGASAAVAREAAAEAGRPRSRQRGAPGAWAAEEGLGLEEGGEEGPTSSGEMFSGDLMVGEDSDEDVDSTLLTSEEDDEDDDGDEGGGGRGRRARGRAAAEASRHSNRLAARRGGGGAGTSARRGVARAAAAEEEAGADHDVREGRQRQDREARAARRRSVQQERLAEERQRRQRQAAARRRQADSSDEEISSEDGDEDGNADEAGPSRRAAPRGGGSRRRRRAEMESEEEEEAAASEGRPRKRARPGRWRDPSNYAWLAVSEQTPGVYVPQAGDACVYLREGHEQYLAAQNDKRPPPWQLLRRQGRLRPAEPCRVVSVEYVIANDGTDYTLAHLTLALADGPLTDTCFNLDVPPPTAGHAEFLVHRSRFEAAVLAKCWAVGEACQSYWNDDDSPDGKWWLGAIVEDQRGGQHADVLADPWGAGGLWNRYEVAWQGVVGPAGELLDGQAPNSQHCPWELFTPGTTHQAALEESAALDPALTQRMLAAVKVASQQERFELFRGQPQHTEIYMSRNRRLEPYNRLVALPLALEQAEARLRSGYYRQPEALASDLATIASNAVAFNGEGDAIAEDAAALAAYLSAVLAGQEPDLAEYATMPEDAEAAAAEAAAGAGGRGRRSGRSGRRRSPSPEQQEQQQWPDLLQQELQRGAVAASGPALPLPALPLPAFGAAVGRPASGGMRVRFTVPNHLRAAAAEEASGAGLATAAEPQHSPDAVAAAAAATAAVARALAGIGEAPAGTLAEAQQQQQQQRAAAAEPPTAGAVPLQPPADLFASLAAAMVAGDGPPMFDAAAAAAAAAPMPSANLPAAGGAAADWFAGLPAAPALPAFGGAWPAGGSQLQAAAPSGGGRRGRMGAAQPSPAQQDARTSRGRAVQRRSYQESDSEGEDDEEAAAQQQQAQQQQQGAPAAAPAAEADAWAHAFETHLPAAAAAAPQPQSAPRRKPRRDDDGDWELEEESDEEISDASGDDFRPGGASSRDESEEWSSDSGGGGRARQRRSSGRAQRKRRR